MGESCCPHALAWTNTFDEARQNLIIHCTIDKTHPDPEFIESIHAFVSAWSDGMRAPMRDKRCVGTAIYSCLCPNQYETQY